MSSPAGCCSAATRASDVVRSGGDASPAPRLPSADATSLFFLSLFFFVAAALFDAEESTDATAPEPFRSWAHSSVLEGLATETTASGWRLAAFEEEKAPAGLFRASAASLDDDERRSSIGKEKEGAKGRENSTLCASEKDQKISTSSLVPRSFSRSFRQKEGKRPSLSLLDAALHVPLSRSKQRESFHSLIPLITLPLSRDDGGESDARSLTSALAFALSTSKKKKTHDAPTSAPRPGTVPHLRPQLRVALCGPGLLLGPKAPLAVRAGIRGAGSSGRGQRICRAHVVDAR